MNPKLETISVEETSVQAQIEATAHQHELPAMMPDLVPHVEVTQRRSVADYIGNVLQNNRRKLATVTAIGASAFALCGSASAAETCTTETQGNTTIERCVSDDGTTTETTTTEENWEFGNGKDKDKPKKPNKPNKPAKPDKKPSKPKPAKPEKAGNNHDRNPNISKTGRLRYNFDQGDRPWGNGEYRPGSGSGQTYASSGCGDTALAMMASNLKGKRITPLKIGRNFGKYHMAGGMDHDMPMAVGKRLGFKTQYVGENMRAAKRVLKNDGLAVALAQPGIFTSAGHMITLSWDKKRDGFRVADPNGDHDHLENRVFSARELLRKGNIDKVWTYKNKR